MGGRRPRCRMGLAVNEIKPNGCKDAPPITSNPAKPGAPAVWNPHAKAIISGPFDPLCAYCRWRGVEQIAQKGGRH